MWQALVVLGVARQGCWHFASSAGHGGQQVLGRALG